MHCIALHCIALHHIAFHCHVSPSIGGHYIHHELHCSIRRCFLDEVLWRDIALFFIAWSCVKDYTILHGMTFSCLNVAVWYKVACRALCRVLRWCDAWRSLGDSTRYCVIETNIIQHGRLVDWDALLGTVRCIGWFCVAFHTSSSVLNYLRLYCV